MKLIEGKQYRLKGFDSLLIYRGVALDFDYACELCNKKHYSHKTGYKKLHQFEVSKDNNLYCGTSCINKLICK